MQSPQHQSPLEFSGLRWAAEASWLEIPDVAWTSVRRADEQAAGCAAGVTYQPAAQSARGKPVGRASRRPTESTKRLDVFVRLNFVLAPSGIIQPTKSARAAPPSCGKTNIEPFWDRETCPSIPVEVRGFQLRGLRNARPGLILVKRRGGSENSTSDASALLSDGYAHLDLRWRERVPQMRPCNEEQSRILHRVAKKRSAEGAALPDLIIVRHRYLHAVFLVVQRNVAPPEKRVEPDRYR